MTAEYFFWGVVHPERANVTITPNVGPSEYLGGPWWINLSVTNSQIQVVVLLPAPTDDVNSLHNAVTDTVGRALDALGGIEGSAYRAEIKGAMFKKEEHYVHAAITGEFPGLADEAPFDLAADELIALALREPQLAEALAELGLAVSRPGRTPFHAWRAIEACRQHFQVGEKKRDAWRKLSEVPNLPPGIRETIRAHDVDGVRHGLVRPVLEDERRELLIVARQVVNSLSLYLAGRAEPLPDSGMGSD